MKQIVMQHPVVLGAVAFYIFSAAIAALPDPKAAEGMSGGKLFYQWLYAFGHTLLNNVEAAMKAKYPNMALLNPAPKAAEKQWG